MQRRRSSFGLGGVSLVCLLFSAAAHAQSASDKAAAESLFDEGKKLVESGKVAEACPKFAESLRLDSGIGTMLYLADCYERAGQTASAWAQFREAAAAARREGDAREKIARKRATRLEPKLSKLSIHVSSPIPGLEVRRDGELVSQTLWDSAVPVDPGKHAVTASAPGKKPWEGSVEVASDGASASAEVPALEDAPASAVERPAAGPPSSSVTPPMDQAPPSTKKGAQTQRYIGIGVAGAGVIGIGLGSFFGLKAKSTLDDSNNHCRSDNHCDAEGVQGRDDAHSQATISTIAFIAGGAALAGGAVLYFTAPKSRTTVGLAPAAGPRAQGLTVYGRF